jgi:tetratricopeptide (TPR) repeat protein/transcriptional regulator with XRE-family HTH domain
MSGETAGRGGAFGAVLRSLRGMKGLTQEELAERSGLSVYAISMLERGVRRTPRSSTVEFLAEALKLDQQQRAALAAAARQSAEQRRVAVGSHALSIPRELPRPAADFIGRSSELAVLRHLLEVNAGPTGQRRAVVIRAIDGMGGVGKSALAIHFAHEVADTGAFPDGQLYVNLHGATSGLAPLAPLDALSRMLRSLGLDPAAIPADVEEAGARWRSLAAGRRLLVLLDNARSAEQIRPLLPGSPTCGVLITSRHVLATLEGTQTLHMDVLPQEQALELFGQIAGRERVTAEPEATAEVVGWCARLPLAIRIVGARLAARPRWSIGQLAESLSDATHRLEALQIGELAVRASFDVSLHALRKSPDPMDQSAAAKFGLLSLPEGPDLGVATAARLLDQPYAATESLLERLVDAQLLESPQPSRYQFHDLVRLYARQDAAQWHPESERVAALNRTAGFYTATAWHSLVLLRPGDQRLAAADPRWSGGGLEFADTSAALIWLEAERANLLAAIAQAASESATGISSELPGQLTQALFGLFYVRGYWHDWVRANESFLAVARRIQDRAGEARANHDLGSAYWMLGRHAESMACRQESLAIFREMGDRRGQAGGLNNLGHTYGRLGQHSEAIDCLHESLAIYRDLRDQRGHGESLTNLGIVYGRTGRYSEAIASLQEALTINQGLGDQPGQAASLNELGVIYAALGRHREAIASLQESLVISRALGDRPFQANSLNTLGLVYGRIGQAGGSIACLNEGLRIFRELGARQAQALALRDLGDSLHAVGRNQEARRAWDEGLGISEALQILEADEIRARLATLGSEEGKPC